MNNLSTKERQLQELSSLLIRIGITQRDILREHYSEVNQDIEDIEELLKRFKSLWLYEDVI